MKVLYLDPDDQCPICNDEVKDCTTYYETPSGELLCYECSVFERHNPFTILTPVRVLIRQQIIDLEQMTSPATSSTYSSSSSSSSDSEDDSTYAPDDDSTSSPTHDSDASTAMEQDDVTNPKDNSDDDSTSSPTHDSDAPTAMEQDDTDVTITTLDDTPAGSTTTLSLSQEAIEARRNQTATARQTMATKRILRRNKTVAARKARAIKTAFRHASHRLEQDQLNQTHREAIRIECETRSQQIHEENIREAEAQRTMHRNRSRHQTST